VGNDLDIAGIVLRLGCLLTEFLLGHVKERGNIALCRFEFDTVFGQSNTKHLDRFRIGIEISKRPNCFID
jgi:hypothetical protein